MNHKEFTQDQFYALALIYCSHADTTMSSQEIAFITNKVGETNYKEMLQHYNSHGDYDCIQTLMALKEQFYTGEEGSAALIGEFTTLFKADSDFCNLEKNVLRLLVRLLK